MSRQDDIDYDRQADQIRAENAVLLEGFETWLEESGLKEKTVRKHMGNVSFYIDDYLLYLVEASEYQAFLAEVKSEMPEWLGHYRDFEAW